MKYSHIASRLFNTPLLIHPGKLDAIIAGLSSRMGLDLDHTPQPYGFAPSASTALAIEPDDRRSYTLQNGVALLNIFGVLAHRTTMRADSSMVLGYDRIAQTFQAALADPSVRAIVLNLDSPGGEVAGAFELAAQIHAARGQKPIVAVASDLAASAAYLIASAADSISVSETAVVGSIGVVMCHLDCSQALAKAGVAVTHIYAGAHKVDGNPYEPLPEAVAEQFQTNINHYYDLFTSAVASQRRQLSVDAIRATEAGLYIGHQALKAGLADHIETTAQAVARLRIPGGGRKATALIAPPSTRIGAYVMDPDDLTTPSPDAAVAPLSAAFIAEQCLVAGEPALGRALLSTGLTDVLLQARLAQAKTIRTLAARLHLPAEAEPLILAGITPDQAQRLLWSKDVERDQALPVDNARGAFAHGADARDKFKVGAVAALMGRAGLTKPDPANEFRRFGLKDLSAECLRRAGENPMTFSTDLAMIKAAITHTGSDFPVLLENVLNKTLLETYSVASDTWRQWCAVGSVSDFRPYKRLRLGSFGNLDALLEGGEYKHKAIPDANAESVSISTKANTTTLTRQAIINDDLGGFTRLAQMLARAAARSIEADAYALLVSNPKLDSDTTDLFHANHGNLHTGSSTNPAAAITMTSLDTARSAIKIQKDRSGNDYIGINEPFILLCPVAKAGAARTANLSEFDPDTANKLNRTNITRGIFKAIVDSPYLSGNAWYLLADPMQFPTFEVLFLNGQQTPFADRIEGQNIDGVTWLVRHDYGVNVVDYVGALKNDGA
ncbi:MAG: S49 family peptidase [Candidatus Contendobacter sp.]|nr:S49 family peptidase [Candidatus Contendobacter sp.]